MNHKFYDAKIVNTKNHKSYLYYWMHLYEPELTHQLNFEKSTFFATKWTFKENLIYINSLEHYNRLKAKDKEAKFGVELDEIYLTDQFDITLDMFTFLPFTNNIFISERLYMEIVKSKITGFELNESKMIKL